MTSEAQDQGSPRAAAGAKGLRYLLVGAWNTLFGYGLFAALVLALGDTLSYLVLLVVSYVASVTQAFALYRILVFRVTGNLVVDYLRFWGVYVTAFLANLALLPLLVEGAGVPVLAAQAAVVGLTVALSYLAHERFSFRRSPASAIGEKA